MKRSRTDLQSLPSLSSTSPTKRSRTDIQSPPSSQLSTSTSPTSSLHLSYVYAQKLNNNAALCIECGQYDRAESTLTKALRLSKAHIQKTKIKVCKCYHCTLDGCIIFSEDSQRALNVRATGRGTLDASTVSKQHPTSSSCSSDISHRDCYIYKKAIRVPCLKICDGHNMGPVLSLIIAFNLGLTRHLRAMEEGGHEAANTDSHKRTFLEKSLRLYEVAYKCLKQRYSGSDNNGYSNEAIDDYSCLQFKIILFNNLCHAHRCLDGLNKSISNVSSICNGSESVHHKYHEGLLSALMCVLERKVTRKSGENDSNSIHFLNESPRTRFVDLEGFWKTVGHLVLTAPYADAA